MHPINLYFSAGGGGGVPTILVSRIRYLKKKFVSRNTINKMHPSKSVRQPCSNEFLSWIHQWGDNNSQSGSESHLGVWMFWDASIPINTYRCLIREHILPVHPLPYIHIGYILVLYNYEKKLFYWFCTQKVPLFRQDTDILILKKTPFSTKREVNYV